MKDVEIQTEPPDKLHFTGLLTQWVIYDKYIKYEAAKELAEIEDNKTCVSRMRRKFHEKKEEQVLEMGGNSRKESKCQPRYSHTTLALSGLKIVSIQEVSHLKLKSTLSCTKLL